MTSDPELPWKTLATSLDPEVTLKQLADFLIARYADYCLIYERSTAHVEATIRLSASAHRACGHQALQQQKLRSPSLKDASGPGRVIRTGTLSRDADFTLTVPLRARSKVLGAVVLGASLRSTSLYLMQQANSVQTTVDSAAILWDNARLYQRARGAIKTRDHMLTAAAHDLRNSLDTVGHACALAEHAGSNEHRRNAYRVVARTIARSKPVLRDLTDVTLLNSGGLDVRPCGPAELVIDAYDSFGPQAAQHAIELSMKLTEPLPNVLADRNRLRQVFANLIDNALTYVPPGRQVVLSAVALEDSVQFEVSDDGPGLPQAAQSSVFKRQLEHSDHQAGCGSGLGLLIVRRIVEAHGGDVELYSTPGEGCRFVFFIPACPRAPAAKTRESGVRLRACRASELKHANEN